MYEYMYINNNPTINISPPSKLGKLFTAPHTVHDQ